MWNPSLEKKSSRSSSSIAVIPQAASTASGSAGSSLSVASNPYNYPCTLRASPSYCVQLSKPTSTKASGLRIPSSVAASSNRSPSSTQSPPKCIKGARGTLRMAFCPDRLPRLSSFLCLSKSSGVHAVCFQRTMDKANIQVTITQQHLPKHTVKGNAGEISFRARVSSFFSISPIYYANFVARSNQMCRHRGYCITIDPNAHVQISIHWGHDVPCKYSALSRYPGPHLGVQNWAQMHPLACQPRMECQGGNIP